MIKAVICDLDGTLLTSNKKVSNRNRQALINCAKNGMKIAIATARPPRSVNSFLPREIYELASFIYYNGGLIFDKETGFEKHIPIPQEIFRKILDYWTEHFPASRVSIEVKDQWLAHQNFSDAIIDHFKSKPTVLEMEQLKSYSPTKILITEFDPFDQIEPFEAYFKDKVNITVTDKGKLIQIMNKGVSKASGVLTLCDHLGIASSDIIVFGDDFNDVEMFELAGYSVAMENAEEKLKMLADEVTVSNNHDGVASVLERILSKGDML